MISLAATVQKQTILCTVAAHSAPAPISPRAPEGGQREAGANAKVIDSVPEPVPALPPPPDGPNKVMDAADTAVGARERKPRKRMPSPTGG